MWGYQGLHGVGSQNERGGFCSASYGSSYLSLFSWARFLIVVSLRSEPEIMGIFVYVVGVICRCRVRVYIRWRILCGAREIADTMRIVRISHGESRVRSKGVAGPARAQFGS